MTPTQELSSPAARWPGGWLGQIGPFLILAISGWLLLQGWSEIPQRFASHYDGSFEPDGWTEKSALGLASPLLAGAVLCFAMTVMSWNLLFRARSFRESSTTPMDRRRAVAEVLLASSYMIALDFALIALFPLAQGPERAQTLVIAILLVTIFSGLALTIFAILRMKPSFEGLGRKRPDDGTPDEAWLFDLIYYNPEDPALFVENRIGMGFTFNFARPTVWLLLLSLTLAPILILLFLR